MYNRLEEKYWITKNGEKLNPETDMTTEHIVNVMNMLSSRAKSNDARMELLKGVMGEEDYKSLLNNMQSTDTITSDELVNTPLFKSLVAGLIISVRHNKSERSRNAWLETHFSQRIYEDLHPINVMYN